MAVLNYAWLNKGEISDPERQGSKSPIPTEYLDNAIKAATDNPDVGVYVWADFDKMNDESKKFLENFVVKPRNFSFRNLNDVKAYKENPLFHNPKNSIWQRVDLARLLVLEQVIHKEKADVAYYSDFDVILPQIASKAIQDSLKKTGHVFCHDDSNRVENAFFGIDGAFARKHNLLKNRLIPSTIKSYGIHRIDNGWMAFEKYVDHISKTFIGKPVDFKNIWEYAAVEVGKCTAGDVTIDKSRSVISVVEYPHSPQGRKSPLAAHNAPLVAAP